MARPSDYRPEYCQRVVELGKLGASVVEMASDIGVARATIEANWPAAHPEFLEAFTLAKQESQVWWERKGRENLEKPTFQASVWSRSMAARFPHDWREVKGSEITGKNGGPIEVSTKEQRDAAVAAAMRADG